MDVSYIKLQGGTTDQYNCVKSEPLSNCYINCVWIKFVPNLSVQNLDKKKRKKSQHKAKTKDFGIGGQKPIKTQIFYHVFTEIEKFEPLIPKQIW